MATWTPSVSVVPIPQVGHGPNTGAVLCDRWGTRQLLEATSVRSAWNCGRPSCIEDPTVRPAGVSGVSLVQADRSFTRELSSPGGVGRVRRCDVEAQGKSATSVPMAVPVDGRIGGGMVGEAGEEGEARAIAGLRPSPKANVEAPPSVMTRGASL